MSDMLTALRLLISGDSTGAVAAIKAVGDATEATDAKTDAANATQVKAVTAMGALTTGAMVAGGALAGLTAVMGLSLASYAKWGEAVIKGASLTGMSVEQYSKLAGELKAYNVSADTATTSMKFFEKQTWAAESGTAASVKAFKDLGISVDQLKLMPTAQAISLVRDRLSQLQNPAEKTALLVQLFGRGSANMTLWANASADQMQKVDGALQQTGQILDTQHAKQLKQAGKDWMKFKSVLQGLEITIAEDILPAVDKLVKAITAGMVVVKPFVGLIPIAAAGLTALLVPLLAVIGAVKTYELVVKGAQVAQELFRIGQVALAVATRNVTVQEGIQILTVDKSTAAKTANAAATAEDTAALGTDDAALATNDAAEATNTADVEANTIAREANAAAAEGGGLAGASADLGAVGTGAEGAAAAGGMGAGAAVSAIAIPIAAGIAAGMLVQSHATQRTQAQKDYLAKHGSFKAVPRMAQGGIVKGSPDGTLIVAGEGNVDEQVGPVGGSRSVVVQVTGPIYGAIDRATAQRWAAPLGEALGDALYNTVTGAGH